MPTCREVCHDPDRSLQRTARLMAKAAIEIPERLSRRPAPMRRYREGRSLRLRHPGDAGELRGGQGRPPRHVRRYRRAALVRQDRQRGAHRGRPDRARSRAAPRHRQRDRTTCRCGPTACTRSGAPTTTTTVGIGAPEIEYAFHPDADWIELTTVHKGGLFGSDYRMLFPGDGIEGIKRFYLDTLIAFGKRGLACQPAIVGVGLGGSKDICMVLGKQAACLRTVGSRNPDPEDRRARRWSSRSSATPSAWAPWASWARPWWSIATSRSATATPAACR